MTPIYLRNRSARIVEQTDKLYVLDPRGTLSRLDNDSASLARAVLQILELPQSRAQLFAALQALIGGPVEPAQVVDDLLSFLQQSGAIQQHSSNIALIDSPSNHSAGFRIVLAVTGAVQSMHTPTLVSLLQSEGHTVRVAMTAKARKFVRPASLEALTHHSVVDSLWNSPSHAPAPHIQLAEWADLVLIAPASASTIARIATGSCVDPVSATAVATRAPVIVAPSMNEAMFDSPSVQRNLNQLRDDGMFVVHPMTGLEVATAPQERTSMGGVMVAPNELVRIVRALGASHLSRRDKLAQSLSADSEQWLPRYTQPQSTRPWDSDELDEGLLSSLKAQLTAPSRVLDLGCGTGLLATTLASLEHNVVAVDGAQSALELAVKRAHAKQVQWVCANALGVVLSGEFALVHDRAFLHVLPPIAHALYVERMQRWVKPGGVLVLTAHNESTSEALGTSRFTTRAIRTLFQRWFTVDSAEECHMRAPAGEAVPARRYVLRRRATR